MACLIRLLYRSAFCPVRIGIELALLSATYFIIDEKSSSVPDCNMCKSGDTEIIPISTDESFRIGHSQTRGMEIEFHKK